MKLRIQQLDPDLKPPAYANQGDAGMDLRARHGCVVPARERTMVDTGIAIAVPPGCVGLVHPRSGLAANNGITVLNAPGTIDSGYRGEVKVILVNHSDVDHTINRGDRIAQLVIQEVLTPTVEIVNDLDDTARGDGGFGSTGTA